MNMLRKDNNKNSARLLASLMLSQMVIGILLNFHFISPVLRYDGTLSAQQLTFILGCATLLALVISSLNVVFGLLLPKDNTKAHSGLFVMLIAFASIGIAMSANEYAKLSEYVVFLSSSYSIDAAASDTTLEYMKKLLATGRNEAHFYSIFISSISLLLFYVLMMRASLLPFYLAVFAVLSTLLQLIAVGHTFFEMSIPNIMQLPLFVTQIIVPAYLLKAGFNTDAKTSDSQIEQIS